MIVGIFFLIFREQSKCIKYKYFKKDSTEVTWSINYEMIQHNLKDYTLIMKKKEFLNITDSIIKIIKNWINFISDAIKTKHT